MTAGLADVKDTGVDAAAVLSKKQVARNKERHCRLFLVDNVFYLLSALFGTLELATGWSRAPNVTPCTDRLLIAVTNLISRLECNKQIICLITFQVLPSLHKLFLWAPFQDT